MILVVDDDASIRDALSMLLESEGYDVACKANGREALDFIRSNGRPCMIFLDLMMPVMDGRAFLSAQEADPALAKIPVVVVTAAGNWRTLGLGERPVLAKPLKLEPLLEAAGRYC